MAILTCQQIKERIFGTSEINKRLIVTPLLEPESQLQDGSSSLDIRLGTHFLQQRRTTLGTIEPGKAKSPADIVVSVSRVVVPFGQEFVLHPNQFTLGCSLEYFKMPLDLSAYVVGRSSWGRLGLIVATAIGIHPLFRGIITLELTNLGEVPIILRPGRTIAQIFFHTTEGQIAPQGVITQSSGDSIPQAIYDFPDKEYEKIAKMGKV
jgi:dCTP deaminase